MSTELFISEQRAINAFADATSTLLGELAARRGGAKHVAEALRQELGDGMRTRLLELLEES